MKKIRVKNKTELKAYTLPSIKNLGKLVERTQTKNQTGSDATSSSKCQNKNDCD